MGVLVFPQIQHAWLYLKAFQGLYLCQMTHRWSHQQFGFSCFRTDLTSSDTYLVMKDVLTSFLPNIPTDTCFQIPTPCPSSRPFAVPRETFPIFKAQTHIHISFRLSLFIQISSSRHVFNAKVSPLNFYQLHGIYLKKIAPKSSSSVKTVQSHADLWFIAWW